MSPALSAHEKRFRNNFFVLYDGQDHPDTGKKSQRNAGQYRHETLAEILPLAESEPQAADDHGEAQY